jgi:hypothetical protein
MSDWRELERDLVDWFERQGYRVNAAGAWLPFGGDRLVERIDLPINLSALAQDLCARSK